MLEKAKLKAERDEALAQLHERGPQLGLATTREILEELRARGDVAAVAHQTEADAVDGMLIGGLASCILRAVRPKTLDYRTVDNA